MKQESLEALAVDDFLAMEFHDEEIIGGRLLQVRGLMLIAGATEVGKSFLVKQLAYELATGGQWLGWDITRPFKTLLVQAEIGRAAFQERMRKLSKHYGRADKLKVATTYTLRLDNEKNWEEMKRVLDGEKTEVLILDPMRPFHLGDENSSQDMEVYFGQVKRLQDETGVAVVQTHHERKPAKDVPSDLYSIRGSALITDRPDTVLRLAKKGKKDPVWKMEYEKIRNSFSTEKPDALTLAVADSGLFLVENGEFGDEDVGRLVGSKEVGWMEVQEGLSGAHGVSMSRVGRVMREMVGAGKLIERSDPEDGRKKLIKSGWG